MEVLSLEDVYSSCNGVLTVALVKMAASGIGIKERSSSEIKTIKAEEIKEITEHYGVIAHTVRITKKDGAVFILDGITADALESIKQYAKKHYKLNVYNIQLSVDGNVHGKIDVSSTCFEMKSGEKTLFEIPLHSISNAYERRGEGIIDIEERYYGVSEIRFGSMSESSNVLKVIEQVKGATASHSETEVLSVEEVTCALPRGKSKLTLTSTGMHLIGKTYSHHILYGSIARLFHLERSAEEGVDEMAYLIFELSTPIRQGQTRYHFVSMLVPEDLVRVTLGKNSVIEYKDASLTDTSASAFTSPHEAPASPAQTETQAPPHETPPQAQPETQAPAPMQEEEKAKMEELGLSLTYEGSLSHCLVSVLEKLSKVSAVTSGAFSTMMGGKALKCSSKANEGYLYPLKAGLLFIPKIAYIKYTDIDAIEFSRVNLSTRTAKTFDLRLAMHDNKSHMFNGIQKAEFSAFEGYMTSKGIKCRSEVVEESWGHAKHSDEESADEETASDETSEEESSDEESVVNSDGNG
ncbi:structure-specific recognition protein 1 [Nematocida displodere]|uniref:Structure-specific recognition protein 1 n=1 Tax=Nematocida displodere TaxID=1805483 RepID=A0A177EKI4_9MICR|nr:structure-specific recognition protein 1 [Nematocida displodere]